MKSTMLIPLLLNGKIDEIDNMITYKHLNVSELEIDSLMWEDMRKLIGERIEILPDRDTVTGEKIIRVYGLEMTESEEYSFYNSLNND